MRVPEFIFPMLPHPADYYRQEYRFVFEQLYHAWHQARPAAHNGGAIANIGFAHDPHWRHKLLSVQSARDRNHWIWQATSVIWCGLAGEL
jgi:hypothetical protein